MPRRRKTTHLLPFYENIVSHLFLLVNTFSDDFLQNRYNFVLREDEQELSHAEAEKGADRKTERAADDAGGDEVGAV